MIDRVRLAASRRVALAVRRRVVLATSRLAEADQDWVEPSLKNGDGVMYDVLLRNIHDAPDGPVGSGHTRPQPSRRVARHRLRRIAALLPLWPHWSRQAMRGVSSYAKHDGNWVLEWFPTPQTTLQALADWKPDGILAFCESQERAGELQAICPRIVVVKSGVTIPGLPAVTVDHRAVGHMAADHFVRRGLQHFACLSLHDSRYGQPRADGFAELLHSRRQAESTTFWHQAPPGEQGLHLRDNGEFCQWLKTAPKPLGVFAVDDRLGLETCEVCRDLRLRVPHDVAVLGADDDESLCQIADPMLSSVKTPLPQIGFEAAKLMAGLLGRQKLKPETRLLHPLQVTVRDSCGILAIADPDVATVLRLIHSTTGRPLTVKDLVASVPLSRRALEQKFRAAIGRSPMEEVRHVAMERALQMLLGSRARICEIALACGFGSPVHLSIAFRRRYGVSPRQFRAQFRVLHDPPIL
jgi:LacI family transcriptional regulator